MASGETLAAIAKKYRVTPTSIAQANTLQSGEPLEVGEKLIIPASRPEAETKSKLVRYRVRKGDTLMGVADQFSVTPEEVRKWNRLKSARVSRGMVLRIYTVGGAPEMRAAKATTKSKRRATARVRAGGSH